LPPEQKKEQKNEQTKREKLDDMRILAWSIKQVARDQDVLNSFKKDSSACAEKQVILFERSNIWKKPKQKQQQKHIDSKNHNKENKQRGYLDGLTNHHR